MGSRLVTPPPPLLPPPRRPKGSSPGTPPFRHGVMSDRTEERRPPIDLISRCEVPALPRMVVEGNVSRAALGAEDMTRLSVVIY